MKITGQNFERAAKKLSVLFSFFLISASPAYAATYYFSTSGNNTSGTGSITAPFHSLCRTNCTTGASKISLGQLQINPGDQLLFKRGDEWVGADATWSINATGAANNPLTFGAYGDPSLPRPVFRGAKTAFELGKDTWTNVSGTAIWYATGIDWTPNMAAQEDSAVDGPHLFGATSVQGVTNANGWMTDQSMVRGTYYYDAAADRLYVWRTDGLQPDHAAGRDIYIGVSPTDGSERLVKVARGSGVAGSHYVFQDLHVKMSSALGFSTSYPNTQYINCLSELNAYEGFLFDRRRFGAPMPASKDSVMRNCVARRNNLSQGGGIGQGVTIESENVWLYDSEMYENGYAGVDFLDYHANTNVSGGGIVNCNIHHNGIQPVKMISFDPNLYIDGGSNITIKDSRIWAAGIDPRGTKTRLRPNAGISIDLESTGFAAGKRPTGIKIINTLSYGNTGEAIRIGYINGGQSTPAFSDIQIIGNTLGRDRGDNDIPGYASPTYADTGIRVFSFRNVSSGLVYKNNIVAATNTARAPLYGSLAMYNGGKPVMDFNNNIYYCPGCNFNSTASGLYTHGSATLTIDQFRNLSAAASLQQDQTLTKAVITSNPLLTNLTLTSFDARLLNGSPALDIADPAVFPFPMAGTTRADGAPDSPYNDLGFHYASSVPDPPAPDTEAPTAPSAFTAVHDPVQDLISMTWGAATDAVGVTGYQVLNGTSVIGTTVTQAFTLTGPSPATYNFSAKAYDAAGNISSPSNTVTLTVGAPSDTTPPTAPTGLTATLSGIQVALSWAVSTDNVGVVNYEILNNGNMIGTSVTTGYVYDGTEGQTYNFTVQAKDAANNTSNSSTIVTVTVPVGGGGNPPEGPTNLVASYVNGQVLLSWTAAPNHTGEYNVFRNGAFLKNTATTSTFDNTIVAGADYSYLVEIKSPYNDTASVTIPGPPVDTTAPSIPAGLAAALSGTTANLSWNASTDNVAVTGYQVYRGTAQIGTTASTSYAATGLAQGQTHTFTVRAYDAANNVSASSASASVTIPPAADTTAPSTPTSLTSTTSGSTINLTWTASTDNVAVTGYRVFNNSSQVGSPTTTSYAFSPAAVGQTYNFTVRAIDAAGNVSAASNTRTVTIADTTAPSAPSGLVFSVSGTQAVLTWNASTDNVGVTGYRVYNGSTQIGTTGSSTRTYTHTGLLSGTSYTYTVRAIDAANNLSSASNSVSVNITGPSTPASLVVFLNGSAVSVSWTSSTNATGYSVYRNGTLLSNTASVSFLDPSVMPGLTYSYQVQAYDAANNRSGFSNLMSITIPGISPPTTPANFSASISGRNVSLSWNGTAANVTYEVFRGNNPIATVTSTSFTDKPPLGSSRYKVRAFNSAGQASAFSEEVALYIG